LLRTRAAHREEVPARTLPQIRGENPRSVLNQLSRLAHCVRKGGVRRARGGFFNWVSAGGKPPTIPRGWSEDPDVDAYGIPDMLASLPSASGLVGERPLEQSGRIAPFFNQRYCLLRSASRRKGACAKAGVTKGPSSSLNSHPYGVRPFRNGLR
jgi:hypothetical protein